MILTKNYSLCLRLNNIIRLISFKLSTVETILKVKIHIKLFWNDQVISIHFSHFFKNVYSFLKQYGKK